MRHICFIILFILPFATPFFIIDGLKSSVFNMFGWKGWQGLFSLSNLSLVLGFGNILEEINKAPPVNLSDPVPEDAYLNITELVPKYGYNMEEHIVTTEDGYVLKLYRILPNETISSKNVTVFLMHGILDSADSWLIQGPHEALAYLLADEGYDVWLGNARGNKYSLSHTEYTIKDPNFWKFTWEEIGVYDLPAMIDYLLNVTEQEKIFYIGHSQGTTSFFVMNSMKPEYNEKFHMMFSLSPVVYLSHVKSPVVKMFSPAHNFLGYLLSNYNAMSPTTELFNKLLSKFCSFLARCDNMLSFIVGGSYSNVKDKLWPVIFGHYPSGCSTLQLVHYGQLVQSGEFRRYDYGLAMNYKVYGDSVPPNYDLDKVTVPIVMFYSESDWLADPIDVKKLISKLPNVLGEISIANFSHLDFMYAESAKDVIYNKIIETIYGYKDQNQ